MGLAARYPEGGRRREEEPQGKVARSRKYRGDDEHQGDEDVELSRTPGAAAPDPAAYALSPPMFQPLTAYADAAGSSRPSAPVDRPRTPRRARGRHKQVMARMPTALPSLGHATRGGNEHERGPRQRQSRTRAVASTRGSSYRTR